MTVIFEYYLPHRYDSLEAHKEPDGIGFSLGCYCDACWTVVPKAEARKLALAILAALDSETTKTEA